MHVAALSPVLRLVVTLIGALAVAGAWVFAAGHSGAPPPGAYAVAASDDWPIPPAEADRVRNDALRRAAIRPPAEWGAVEPRPFSLAAQDDLVCRFVREAPTGTTPKFDCALANGEIIKVKYGRNPEIHAEQAASTLLRTLGYAADHVEIVPRLRCYGCPRYPFLTMRLLALARATELLGPHGHDEGYTDFEWAAVERKFPAPAIETPRRKGWGWYELKSVAAPRGEVDAFRLLAVFLAHWDNKDQNQRLVCLDRVKAPDWRCGSPLLLIQDLGSTFGPSKVHLTRWRNLPVWADAGTCTVSMRGLPWGGATFVDARISEEGRRLLSGRLEALDDVWVRELFEGARFGEYYSGTDDRHDLDAWTSAFRGKVDQIATAGPCPS